LLALLVLPPPQELYRLLFTSLRTSSQHFQALNWDTLALGW
jgi:hypothetical protein